MMELQRIKFFSVTPPAVIIDDASVVTAQIDTKGFEECVIVVYLGATDVPMTALAVTESDDNGSGHSNVTGLIWGTSANIDGDTSVLPSATDDNKFQIAQINLKNRKRYLDVTATIGDGTAGTYITILAILSRANESPSTVAETGANEALRV